MKIRRRYFGYLEIIFHSPLLPVEVGLLVKKICKLALNLQKLNFIVSSSWVAVLTSSNPPPRLINAERYRP